MMPGNPVVGGVILRRPAIQSPNYVAGSAGWAVNADGTAQFSDLVIYDPGGTGFFIEVQGSQLLLFAVGVPDALAAGQIVAATPGDIQVYSGGVNDADLGATLECTSEHSAANASGGKSNIALIAETVTLNTTTSSDIPHAHVTGLPLAGGSGTAAIVTAVNNLYAALQACAIIAP
jgi:hypothetical protein